jgi:predicted nucleic acid-binding Zn ribbon protein
MTKDPKSSEKIPRPAGSVLKGLLEQAGFERQIRRFCVFEDWPELVGAKLAEHSKPWRMRGDVLEVRVDHAVWMQQLQLQKAEILREINARLEADSIRDIFWRFGAVGQTEKDAGQVLENLPESSPNSGDELE